MRPQLAVGPLYVFGLLVPFVFSCAPWPANVEEMGSNPTTEVMVPYPDVERPHLRISLGPCRLRLAPGAGDVLARGSYEDPTGLLPLQVSPGADRVSISQSTRLGSLGRLTQAPSLVLELGASPAFQLTVEGGANDTALNLGGVPLTRLAIRLGAGKSSVDFTAPNPAEMGTLEVTSGGVAMEMRNLANANFAEMTVSGGAASYRFEFGGELHRDAQVRLSTGMSSVEVLVPPATPARISSSSMVGGLQVGNGFVSREGAFWNDAALAATGPVLRIAVTSLLGTVRLRAGS